MTTTSLFKLIDNNLITFIYSNDVILCNIFDFDTLEEYFTPITRINDVVVNDTMMPFLSKCFDNEVKRNISIHMNDDKKIMSIDVILESYIPVKKDFVFEKIENNLYEKANLYKMNTLMKRNILGNDFDTDQFPHCYNNIILSGTKSNLNHIIDLIPQISTKDNK